MIEKISDNVFIRTSHIQQMQSVLMVKDDAIYVFDPGYFDDETKEVRALATEFEQQLLRSRSSSRQAISGDLKRRLVLTHSDYDHIVGVPYFDGYEVWTAETWDVDNEVRSIAQIGSFDSQFYIERPWQGEMQRISATRKLKHAETVDGLHFYHAKGHTDDGLVTVCDRIAVVGDYLAIVEFPFIYTSVRRYIQTMETVREVFAEHDVDLVITQHGPYARGREEIGHRLSISEDYLQSLLHLVTTGKQAGHVLDEVTLSGKAMTFAGRPLSPGIARFHEENIRLAWNELFANETPVKP